MEILTTEQIRQADQYTIQHEPISSVDLMERAATQVFEWLMKYMDKESKVKLFCGMGNNGGDGLVVARLLYGEGFLPEVFMVRYSEKMSPDCEANYRRLQQETQVPIHDIRSEADFPLIQEGEIIIDAMFGSGLNRAIEGMAAALIDYLNQQQAFRIAIDIASGLFADSPSPSTAIFQPDYTLTFQVPKMAFLMPENDAFTGQLEILDIGLHPQFLDEVKTHKYLIDKKSIQRILHRREKFSHKGNYGHALLVAGSEGKTGAAILSAKSCLRTGVGLLSVKLPESAWTPLQVAVPEAMIHVGGKLDAFSAVGVGPGLGTGEDAQRLLKHLIQDTFVPMVLDADALNILAENKTWLSFLRPGSVLTPHPKEFERLFGKTSNSFERLDVLRENSTKYGIVIVLKGAYTTISTPTGLLYFNPTGNPGMATAGSGDVLTGMILSLLAQFYYPSEAAKIGVFLHGLAGDFAAMDSSQEAMIASDITENIGKAYTSLK